MHVYNYYEMIAFFFCLLYNVELQSSEATPAATTLGPADVFVSYCWVNSEKAHRSKQVRVSMTEVMDLTGDLFSLQKS